MEPTTPAASAAPEASAPAAAPAPATPDRSAELASLVAELDAADGEGESSAPPPASKSADPKPEKAEPKADDKPADKPKEEKEPLGKSYAEVRRKRQELDKRERTLADNEKALTEKATRADKITAAVARANDGDVEALAELGLDLEKLGAAQLRSQSGDARVDRLERELAKQREDAAAAQKKADDEATAKKGSEAAQAQFIEIRNEITKASEGLKLLSKRDATQRVLLCEEVAQEFVAQKRAFTMGEVAQEVEARLTTAAKSMAEEMGYVLPAAAPAAKPAARPPSTISHRDASGKIAAKAPVLDRKSELADLAALIDG